MAPRRKKADDEATLGDLETEEATADSEPQAKAEKPATKKAEPQEDRATAAQLDARYDEELRNFQDFNLQVNTVRTMGIPRDQDPRVVGHVPADRCVTWATHPKIDNGQHLTLMKSKGFREVRIEEVTNNANLPSKLYVKSYAEGPNGTVTFGGGILLIGYRQFRDKRRAAERFQFQQQLDNHAARTEGVGVGGRPIQVEHSDQLGGLKEVQR